MLPFVSVPTNKIPLQAGNSLAYNPSAFFNIRNEKFKNATGDMNLQDIIDEMQRLGFNVDTRPNALNVVGIRDASVAVPENYSDNIAYFWFDDNGDLQGKIAEATTTPSVQYLKNPIAGSSGGTAIMKQGQYKNAYQIGIHRSKYEALVQTGGPVTVIRDSDRNSILNYFGNVTTGYYGINIHRSTASYASQDLIGPDSAGCQVFRWRDDFNDMMAKAKRSRDLYGNKFTYTLIDQREQMQNARKKGINLTVIGGVLIGLSIYGYILYKKGIIFKK
jgi:hypothetical protein